MIIINYTEPAGKIFWQDLLNLHGDIVEQSTEAFESHCVKLFSSVGIKVAGEDIREFNHIKCLLFSSEMKAKYDEDPFLPLRLTFQYIHSNSDKDNFSRHWWIILTNGVLRLVLPPSILASP